MDWEEIEFHAVMKPQDRKFNTKHLMNLQSWFSELYVSHSQ